MHFLKPFHFLRVQWISINEDSDKNVLAPCQAHVQANLHWLRFMAKRKKVRKEGSKKILKRKGRIRY